MHELVPDPSVLNELQIDSSRVIILVRPPATMAHYAVKASALVFAQVLSYLCSRSDVQLIILPRTGLQAAELRDSCAKPGICERRLPGHSLRRPQPCLAI